MKRILGILLSFALLLPAAAQAAGAFTATDETDARRKALECFRVCAFSSEYGGDTARGYLIRWEGPIRVYAAGSPSREDLAQLDGFLAELSLRVPMLPPVERVADVGRANVVIHYIRLSEMSRTIPGYVPGNWGYFSYQTSGRRITRSVIGIAIDKCDQRTRNHLMREELVGSLGLCNDHDLYSDSILYQPWTTVQTLSKVDWLMLNFLYSDLVSPGDDWETAERAIRAHYGL